MKQSEQIQNFIGNYNGQKRAHAIKFQSVIVPYGLIANLSGPYDGKRYDSTMLYLSGLLPS